MSEEESKQTTEESQVGANADAAGSASAAGSAGVNASSKKSSEEKKKPKKLGQKEKAQQNGEAQETESKPSTPQKMERSQSRQGSQSRGRGRPQSQPPSDVDSAYRSESSQKPKRQRQRNRNKQQVQEQEQQGGGGGGGPLDAVDEVGETVDGVADGAQDLVQNTAGSALKKPQEALGGLLKNKGGKKDAQKGGEEEEKDEGENEQLRLRLDLNLDIEVQLKAKIHGDLTIGLLYVDHPASPFTRTKLSTEINQLDQSTSHGSYAQGICLVRFTYACIGSCIGLLCRPSLTHWCLRLALLRGSVATRQDQSAAHRTRAFTCPVLTRSRRTEEGQVCCLV